MENIREFRVPDIREFIIAKYFIWCVFLFSNYRLVMASANVFSLMTYLWPTRECFLLCQFPVIRYLVKTFHKIVTTLWHNSQTSRSLLRYVHQSNIDYGFEFIRFNDALKVFKIRFNGWAKLKADSWGELTLRCEIN